MRVLCALLAGLFAFCAFGAGTVHTDFRTSAAYPASDAL